VDDTFLAALFPGRHRVLGFRLQPFCRGHVAALFAVSSPMLAEPGSGARISAGDLVVALRICSRPGWPLLAPDDIHPHWRDLFLRLWLAKRPERLREAVEKFRDYRDAHGSFPTFYSDESVREHPDLPEDIPSERPLTAPAVLAQVCSLTSRTTIRWELAWQLPLALPTWIIGTLNEMEGGPVRFLYESDETGDDLPADIASLSEKELFQQAVNNLGSEPAKEWRKARQKMLRKKSKRAGQTRRPHPEQ
jgi:hypothetical protein